MRRILPALAFFLFSNWLYSQSLTFQKAGEWGNQYYSSVAVDGNYAYCLNGDILDVIDVTVPASPFRAGGVIADDQLSRIVLQGGFAYILSNRGMTVFDLSNPVQPVLAGKIGIAGDASALEVSGGLAFVTTMSQGLKIIDISNPLQPQMLHTYAYQGMGGIARVSGNLLYVVENENDLRILNIADPSNPVLLGTFDGSTAISNLVVGDSQAFLAHWQSVTIVNVSAPAAPFQEGTYADQGHPTKIRYRSNYLYIGASGDGSTSFGGIRAVDVSVPSSPKLTGDAPFTGNIAGFDLAGNLVFFSASDQFYENDFGLQIYDVSNPALIAQLGAYNTSGQPYSMEVKGSYGYVCDLGHGVRVIDVTDLLVINQAGLASPANFGSRITIYGDYAYVGGGSYALGIYDLTAPTAPNRVGYCAAAGSMYKPFLSGQHLFVPESFTGLQIFNISNPANPSSVSVYDTPGAAYGVFVSGNYAYVADGSSGLTILDVSDPASPSFVSGLATFSGAMDVVVSGSTAYVAAANGMHAVNVANPAAPAEIGHFTSSGLDRLILSGDYLYALQRNDGMLVLDVSDPSQPVQAGFYAHSAWLTDIFKAGDLVYLVDYWDRRKITIIREYDQYLHLVSPNGGESYRSGEDRSITWTGTGNMGNVRLEYSTDSGFTWSTIVASTEDDGAYSWPIPEAAASSACLVRVSDAASGVIADASDAVFTIGDGTPDAFVLIDQTAMPLSTVIVSNTITVAGIANPVDISITGGEYAVSSDGGVNWGSWTSDGGMTAPNDQVKVRQTSSSSFLTQTTATLTIGGVSDVFAVTTAGAGDPRADGLISWWKGENNALDSVGAHHGTAVGGVAYAAGKKDQGFSLDGTDDYVNAGAWFNLQTFSFSLWINAAASQVTYANIIDNHHDAVNSFEIEQNGSTTNQYYWGSSTAIPNTVFSLTAGQWTHVVMTRDGSTRVGTVYINGSALPSVTGSRDITYAALALVFGRWDYGGRHWAGLLDEIQVYDRVLAAGEVAVLYSMGPDAFHFIDQTGMPLSTAIVSNPIVVTGIEEAKAITVTGGEYAVSSDGGSTWGGWTNAAGTVSLNDQVMVRLTSSANHSTLTSATLTIGAVSDAFDVTTAATGNPDASGLEAWWKGENNAYDSVGGHHGAIHGGVTFAAGKVGQAFDFNGSNYISTADSPTWDLGAGDFTIDAWISTPTPAKLMRLLSAGSHADGVYNLWSSGYGYCDIWGTGQRLNFCYYNGSPYGDISSDQLSFAANTFYHITYVREGTALYFYLNGVQVGSRGIGSIALNGGSTGAIIGARYYHTPSEIIEYANGLIDELRLYHRALSADEVAALYDGTPDGFSLIDQANMPLSTPIVSNPVTVAGINMATAVSVAGGEYSVSTDGGASWGGWTSAAGTVSLGSLVRVRQTSSSSYLTLTTTTLTIGGVSEAFAVTTTASGDPRANGLVSWWRAENNGYDSVGGNHATAHGGVVYPMGRVGQAFGMNSGRYLNTADSLDWDLGAGDFTIEAWISTPTPSSTMRLLASGTQADGASNLWAFGYGTCEPWWGYGPHLNFAYFNGSGYTDLNSSQITMAANSLYHIAVVRSGSTLYFYFNGASAGSAAIGAISLGGGSSGAIIGARYGNTMSSILEYATGLIDELRLYDRALAADEIGLLANRVTVTTPNGGESWMVTTSHNITWTSHGTVGTLNIDYSTDNGANWTQIATGEANDGSFTWTPIPNTPSTTCLIRVREADGSPSDQSDAVFAIVAYFAETVSAPSTPSGPGSGIIHTSYTFTTGGSTSSLGHPVQYLIDWGDGEGAGGEATRTGSDSGWLPVGTTSASHSWSTAGKYNVRAMARCSSDTTVQSEWSTSLEVTEWNEPTWAAITRFAAGDESMPTVEWHTGTEAGTVGFYLWRQDKESKEYELVNPSFLPALPGAPQGGIYRLADPGALSGEPVTYKLEEVDAQGQRLMYGPFTVTFGAYDGATDRVVTLGKGDPVDINGYQRFRREPSAYEKERLRARQLAIRESTIAHSVSKVKERARITVKGKGLFYVTSAQVADGLGISEAKAQALIGGCNLSLTGSGKETAWLADANGAGLFFYNQGLETEYSDKNIYYLEQGSGLMMETLGGGNAGPAPEGQTYQDTLRAMEGHYFLPSNEKETLADSWFWDYVVAGSRSRTFTLNVPGAASTGEATLRVVFRGATATNHHAVVTLNGTEVGSVVWDGGKDQALAAEFSASQLVEGVNTVVVSGLLDDAPYSIFYVDGFELAYPRHYEAEGNRLICRGDQNGVITVSGITEADVVVLDVSKPVKPKQVLGVAPDLAGRVTFVPRDGAKEYLISGLNAAMRPVSVIGDRPARLKSVENSAEYVVIAPEEFEQAAGELAEFRQGKGLKSMVVTLKDIYDAFNFGMPSPYAIRSFLAYAYSKWSGKKLKYAVLAGKGTYDYRDYLGHGDNLVPAVLARSEYGYYAADRVYGDVAGKNLVPEIAIGRLPAITAAELRTLIAKIKAYEGGSGEWTGKALFIADNDDDGGDFAKGCDELASLASGFQAEKIYLSGSAADERTQIAALWNEGAGLVNYCGHSGMTQWAGEELLDADGARALRNGGKLPLAVMLTCVAGRFEVPGYTSLGEALALSSEGGMAGGLVPSGAGMHADSMRLGEGFYRAALAGKGQSAGLALVAAMKEYVSMGGNRFLLNVYNWLGDPAVEFK